MSEKFFLNKLSNQVLDGNLKQLITSEREILTEIILHISEVATRKMYLSYGYPSLFEYLSKRMGYANGSAQRRIDAARLSKEVPEVIDHLESGKINLSQLTILSQAIRQTTDIKTVDKKKKKKFISELQDKSAKETELLVNQILNIPIKEATKTRCQKDESIRLEITFTKEQWQKLVKARDLLSHSLPDGSWDHFFEHLSELVIQKKDKTVLKKPRLGKMDMPEHQSKQRVQKPVDDTTSKSREAVPLAAQREVYNRDQCCQYQDKSTGHKCSSTWQLTLDHIQPIWAGGSNKVENLRVLCANHNRKVYRQQARISNH